MKIKQIFKSLKFKLMLFLFLLVVPLIVILYLNNYYSWQLADQQAQEASQKVVDTYMTQIETKLGNVMEYMLTSLNGLQGMNHYDQNERQMAKLSLRDELKKVTGIFDIVDGFFVYQSQYDEYVENLNAAVKFMDGETLRQAVKKNPDNFLAVDAQTWRAVWLDGQLYFTYTLVLKETYLGAWIDTSRFMNQILSLEIGNDMVIILEEAVAGTRLSEAGIADFTAFIEEEELNYPTDERTFSVKGSEAARLTVSEKLPGMDEMSVEISAFGSIMSIYSEKIPIAEALSVFQIVIMIASGVIAVAMLCFIFIYRRYIFHPMEILETAIGQVERGNWDYRISDEANSLEFSRVQTNFNEMASQIRDLKIDIYEEEIQRQKVELEYLHYQIKPHFFLNVANTINSLAQIQEYQLIQKMTKYLSSYIRYTFRGEHSMVSIRDELENVKSYLGMQQMRFPDNLECTMDIETGLMDEKIPALLVVTFVENTIKHAFDMYESTTITIKMMEIHNGRFRIEIRDNGKGFSPEAIEHIMSGQIAGDQGKHIGIMNIKKRLKLIYADQAEIRAYNDSGACIEIILPVCG